MKITKELKELLKDSRIESYGMETWDGYLEVDVEEFTIYLKEGYIFESEEVSFLHSNSIEEIVWSLKNDITRN